MTKLWKLRSNLAKIRMNYSCHGRYKGIHVGVSLFLLPSSEKKPRTGFKKINFLSLSLVSVQRIQKGISTREQVKEYCNWRKRASLRP